MAKNNGHYRISSLGYSQYYSMCILYLEYATSIYFEPEGSTQYAIEIMRTYSRYAIKNLSYLVYTNYIVALFLFMCLWRKGGKKMKNEIYHPINVIDCECSVNSIDYDATNLVIVLERFDNNQTVAIRFKNVYAYRVTLEHFRICEVMKGLTSQPLYEVENSAYLSEMLMTGMRELYSSSLNVRHYAISTTEHIIDVLTAESYIIE